MPTQPARRRRAGKRRSWAWRHRRGLFFAVFLSFTGLAATAYIMIRVPLPKDQVQKQTTFLTDVSGARLASLDAGEDRVIVKLSDIPSVVQQAVVATEDRNFFRHGGVDPIGTIRAFLNDIRNRGSLQGGSTITQQYVKNTYVGSERTIWRKVREAVLAIKVERKLSKQQILERYLNTIYFGRGAHGVEAASRAYFGKDVQLLGLREAAYLAGLIRAPQYADALRAPAVAQDRRHRTLDSMRRAHMISAADVADVDGTPLASYVINQGVLEPKIVDESRTGYFVDYVSRQLQRDYGGEKIFGSGLIVKTTLDRRMQSQAWDAVYGASGLHENEPAGALVAVDDNGNVKAMVGGRDFNTSKVNLAVGRGGGGLGRQAGSTFKPFLLAETVREGYTVESSFPAPPKIVMPKANNGKDWPVANYEDKDFGTNPVNLIEATQNSINTVYAQLVVTLGAAKLKTMAEQMGVKSPLPAVNSLVLGTAEVSPMEMAAAFSTFGNRGEQVDYRTILEVKAPDGHVLYKAPAKPTRKRVLTTKQADIVNFVLRQVVEDGTGTGASFGPVGSLVGKTGTTNDFGDAWFVGSTTKLSAAVWMGHPEGRVPMDDVRGIKVTGGSFPATIFKRFMSQATRTLDLGSFPDVSSFPGDVLKGVRVPFETTTSTSPGSSTTSQTLPLPTLPGGGPMPTQGPQPTYNPPPTNRPPRTDPYGNTTTTRRKKR